MPNTQSAIKYLRKTKRTTIRNRKIKEKLKALIKKVRVLVLEKNKQKAETVLKKAIQALDKAAEHKYIKKNTADRKKSRLQKLVNKIEGKVVRKKKVVKKEEKSPEKKTVKK